MCSFEPAPVYVCVYVQSKVCTIAWLQGISQYFNLCQDALKSIASISLVCLYKKQSYLFEKSLRKVCTSEHSSKTQLEHKNAAMVVPSHTRGPSVTVCLIVAKTRGLQKRLRLEQVYLILPCILSY